MRVLVTGATGFVGRQICAALLDRGHEVRGLFRPGADLQALEGRPIAWVSGDLTVPASLVPALRGIDAVAHLAGVVAARSAATYHRVNARGTAALAAAAAAANLSRFVHISSLSAQGPSRPGRPHDRPGGERPINAYGRSKLEGERALIEALQGRCPWTILRPVTIYGPEDREMLTWARLIKASRVAPRLPGLELSFLHVADLAALICRLLESPREDLPGPYFVSDGEVHRLDEVVDLLERLIGDRPILRVPMPRGLLDWIHRGTGLISRAGVAALISRTLGQLTAESWTATPTEIAEAFGFEPAHQLRRALPRVFDAYRSQGWL